MFTKSIGCTGVILTKLDGTAKGGVVIAVRQTMNLPVKFVGVGEALDDLQPFDADSFVAHRCSCERIIRFTEILPKTRSGKIMRRLLRELASSGEVTGDITTLEDFSAIALLREVEEV